VTELTHAQLCPRGKTQTMIFYHLLRLILL